MHLLHTKGIYIYNNIEYYINTLIYVMHQILVCKLVFVNAPAARKTCSNRSHYQMQDEVISIYVYVCAHSI